jgi:uncharacterized Zn finger protein
MEWQECATCGGVYVVWRFPNSAPMATQGYEGANAVWFVDRDGKPLDEAAPIACGDCGSVNPVSFHPEQRRQADILPERPTP